MTGQERDESLVEEGSEQPETQPEIGQPAEDGSQQEPEADVPF